MQSNRINELYISNKFNKIIIIFSRMPKSHKGIRRMTRQNKRRMTRQNKRRMTRQNTHRNKRVICSKLTRHNRRTKANKMRGGNYDTDVTTKTMELVPITSKDVVVSMPGHVLSAKDYEKHMEYLDFQGQP